MRLNFVLDKTFKNILVSPQSSACFRCRKNELKFINSLLPSVICRNYSTSPVSFRQLSVLFYGSDDFSLASLCVLRKNLIKNNCENEEEILKNKTVIKRLEVITNSENNPVSAYCKQTNLQCHSFDSYKVPVNQFDLGVVSSFGRLITSQAIKACHYGMLNIHGSLLPRWRGASPIQHTILYDDKLAGITIMSVKPKKFDIGEIIAQKEIDIFNRITAMELKKMMSPLGARLLWECIENLDHYFENSRPQSEHGVTIAPKLKKSDGEIDWSGMNSKEIDCRYRALCGSVDTFTYWIDGTVLKLSDTVDPDLVARFDLDQLSSAEFRCLDRNGKLPPILSHIPGLVFYHKKRHLLCVASANGTWSAFRTLTLKGRKKMSALGFYNTFIRPIKKAYRLENDGQKPFFILGKVRNIEQESNETMDRDRYAGIHSLDKLHRIIDQQRKEQMLN